MLQQTNPSYTAEGNTARLTYLRSAADALGQQGVIQQGAYAEQIAKIQTDLGLSTMEGENELRLMQTAEAQGAERIQMAKDLQATRMGILQTQESLKQTALAALPLDQAMAAQSNAAQSETGTANVGGVDIPLAQITERVDALRQRDYLLKLQKSQSVDMALGELTLPQLMVFKQQALTSTDKMTTIGGLPISLARIQDREQTLMNQDANSLATQYNTLTIGKSLLAETQRQVLQTMSLPELTNLQASGGIAPDGTKYQMDMIQAQRTLLATGQEQAMKDQYTMMTLSDPSTSFLQMNNALDSIKADPTSTLGQFVQSQKKLLQGAAYIADPNQPQTPENLAFSSAILTQIQENTNKAISDEAKKRSGGDKNLATAWEYQLRGQAVPEEVVRTALIEKVTTGKPATEWLNNEQHGILINTYNAAKMRLDNEALMMGAFRPDPATIKQLAAEEAVNAVKLNASNGIKDEVLAMQASQKDNPLAVAGMTGSEILLTTKRADDAGFSNYITDQNMDSKAVDALRAGQGTDQQKLELENYRAAALFVELEKKQSGLGSAYIKWWQSPKRTEMIDSYNNAKQRSFNDLATGMSGYSLLAPSLQPGFSAYANTLGDGERLMMQEQLQKQHAEYITFGGSQESKQVFLLDRDKTLTDAERQQAMATIINPLIEQAKQMGMNSPDQMTNYMETSLRQMIPEDPNQRKLLSKILMHRDETIEILDSFIQISTDAVAKQRQSLGIMGAIGADILGTFNNMSENQLTKAADVPWYKGK
jgi:hypothetical protein